MVSQKPWQIESVVRLFVRLFACFAIGIFVNNALRSALGEKFLEDSTLSIVVAVLAFQVSTLVLVALFIREHSTGWPDAFGFKNNSGSAITLGLATGIVVLPLMWGLQWISIELFTRLGFDVREQEAVRLLRLADTPGKLVLFGVMAIALAPFAEEFLFRGVLYPFVKQSGFPRWALWGVAVVFALIHGNLAALAPLVLLAIVLTLLYEWTNNLLACIVVHSLFNAANFVMLFVLKNSGQLPGN